MVLAHSVVTWTFHLLMLMRIFVISTLKTKELTYPTSHHTDQEASALAQTYLSRLEKDAT